MSKKRADKLINSTNTAIADLCIMSRENFNSRKAINTFAVGIAITVVAFVFQGLSFMVLADAVNSRVSFFDSLMATSASTALANLPITIGGSGLAELGIWAYIANLNGIPNLGDVVNDSQLSVIIVWRIASLSCAARHFMDRSHEDHCTQGSYSAHSSADQGRGRQEAED